MCTTFAGCQQRTCQHACQLTRCTTSQQLPANCCKKESPAGAHLHRAAEQLGNTNIQNEFACTFTHILAMTASSLTSSKAWPEALLCCGHDACSYRPGDERPALGTCRVAQCTFRQGKACSGALLKPPQR